ncbi:pre-rRNA processing protein (nucleomorph) [Lotharella oceanica]|uniref:Pre-rRNA processing protein n=1 Tax=Lotharella oceanica TaxID=641309 RepID=A0A060DBE5_9EUKA|nr:pre-rRNA processing protein [Lotharella oceanica]
MVALFDNSVKLHILLDSSFLYYIVKNKINFFEIFNQFFNKNYILYVTECIIKEISNLKSHNKILIRFINNSTIKKLKCFHIQSYADRCITNKIKSTNLFTLATQDKLLIKTVIKFTRVISFKKKKIVVI